MNKNQIRHLLTRIGISLVFIIFGIWEIMNPPYWAAFLPPFLGSFASPFLLVTIHGAVMLILGIAILTGFYLRISAILAALMMLLIIVALFMLTGYDDLIARDSGLLFLALSIVFDETRYLTLTKH